MDGLLVLADGTVFPGEVHSSDIATGEVVFNTVLSGYQEVITDPSYAGQIVCFTYPHIGNYGVTPEDDESDRPRCRGVIARSLTERPSNRRATESLPGWLARHGTPVLTGIDTRRLTRHLRDAGSICGAFGPASEEDALLAAAKAEPGTDGVDLVAEVTARAPYTRGDGPLRVVAYDLGIKRNILRQLGEIATVEVVPATTPAEEVLARRPDGVFLSNGPGDPETVGLDLRPLLGMVPVFGICLGHQLLARALGGRTYKLRFGHHGGNHPVRRLATGTVEITSQNHNFAVAEGSVPAADVTHVNLNDGVIEGIACRDVPAFSVQYHPEAGPGPHDARYLFEEFHRLMERV
ncbi:glutamine-hydrolyzing carbamoyl-phosphate synthase small subunit [Actinoallomurus rhizosphaericola]|nr:glutamine-hydrolyzing carbamoyl-phosphate synthase small subunit [Actinoallomurus rhizosphaericola]MCO5998842.1 glutamine-hydrolyzing carbamoyl-phosphate synthase small subunit [Actinoallomurus rhizosphaericola]